MYILDTWVCAQVMLSNQGADTSATPSLHFGQVSVVYAMILVMTTPFSVKTDVRGFEPLTCSLGGCRHILARPHARVDE